MSMTSARLRARNGPWVNMARLHLALGYAPIAPSRAARRVDGNTCSREKCGECGHKGLTYRPFSHRRLRAYKAFAVCPVCYHVTEL
jgi:hypothetical protein